MIMDPRLGMPSSSFVGSQVDGGLFVAKINVSSSSASPAVDAVQPQAVEEVEGTKEKGSPRIKFSKASSE